MNLAEIRKKAVGERKPDAPESRPASESQYDDFVGSDVRDLLAGVETGETAVESTEFDFFPDTCEEESCYPETFETGYSLGGQAEPEPEHDFTEQATDLPKDEIEPTKRNAPPVSIQITPVSEDEPASVPAGRHPAYDPLSILLAGRQAATEGAELQVDEEWGHASDEVEEYLCFKVADEEYALSIMSIKEIIKPRELTEVPRMPGFVSGVISLRGVIIPIMDMRLRLSLPVKKSTGRERILVLKTSDGLCGVLVDEVIQVVRIAASAIEGPPVILEGVDREFVMGLGRYDNRMLILLNLESILDLNVH